MRSKIILSILLFVLFTSTVSSQVQEIGISHYIFPSFTKGKILLKTGIVKEVVLNYNSLTEEMIFEANGTKLALANPENVDTIYISDKKFITSGATYYEVLENLQIPLLIRHLCNLLPPGKASGYGGTSETSSIETTSTFYTSGGAYEMKLPEGYKVKPYVEYNLKVGNDYKRIYSTNTVIKCFPAKKGAIQEFVKKNKTDFKKEEDIRSLIIFCNSLK
jgi:hypothetical protein